MRLLWSSVILSVAIAANAEALRQGTVDPAFHTLQVSVNDNVLLEPVIPLGGNDVITVSFDELTDEVSDLRYELIHCTADWEPSLLNESEYLDGFNVADVEEAYFSRGTQVHYVHYRINLPSQDMRPTLSGNYVLRVYRQEDPDHTVAMARFGISEQNITLEDAQVSSITDIDNNDKHQQISFTLGVPESLQRLNPYTDLHCRVTQDNRADRIATVSTPLRVVGNRAIFEHNRDLIFPAGNEYRRFEFISTQWLGIGVEKVIRKPEISVVEVNVDTPRSNGSYLYDQTQFGHFVIRNYDAYKDSDTESDYCLVDFALQAPRSPKPIWIEGDITNRRLDESSAMEWDDEYNMYHKTLLLKQGHYNYQYVAADKYTDIEGDYHPTQHQYTLRIYYRLPGDRYDRLGAVYIL